MINDLAVQVCMELILDGKELWVELNVGICPEDLLSVQPALVNRSLGQLVAILTKSQECFESNVPSPLARKTLVYHGMSYPVENRWEDIWSRMLL